MSYFHTRADLLRYMKMAHSTLKPDGLLFLDLFGGTDAIQKSTRPKKLSNGVTVRDGRAFLPFGGSLF
jgi:hypothetical protein